MNGAARDATALWAVLSDSIDGLTAPLIADEAATSAAVAAALDETLGAATGDDIVLLSFAGHGTSDHRLVLHDTDIANIPGTTIGMDDLAERFRLSRARVVILILDCCFSGGAPARVLDLGLVPRDIGIPLSMVSGNGRILLAASAQDQPALEDPQTRHGLFTKAVLDCLFEAEGAVSIVGLIDNAFRLVRAAAHRLGYEQTPVMFGHVEGDVSLPRGVKGVRYRAAFPERGVIHTTGDFQELAGYGIEQEVLDAWKENFPNGLNTLQKAAVNDHNVLGGTSLLVVAPTSAGKTFVGELAAIKAISEGMKAIFLLPYKAFVNEKFEDFSALYGERLGLRIARCSGDWQDQVGEILRGKYDIAFFTYEKFLGLSAAAPYVLNQLGLVVLDEAQFVTDPGRGMVVELLLTSLVSAKRRGISPQIVALSAVIGDTNRFEHWLGCNLLQTNERPIPLRQGVVDRTGIWQFLDEAGAVQSEQILDRWAVRQRGQRQSSQDMIVPLVQKLVADGEKVIVFRNARGLASGCAQYLARELGLPPAQAVLDELPDGDRSAMSENLRAALEGGTAFHNGDLTRDERIAVEHGFRAIDGGIKVLVATSTVAAGINTPASTVIIVETDFPGAGGPLPYTVATFKNMAGRAGRLGYETEGKAIAIADSQSDQRQIFRRYVQGQPEPIRSSFDDGNPGTWVVRLLAQIKNIDRGAIIDLLSNTYGGYLATLRDANWRTRMIPRLEQLVGRMIQQGLIEEESGLLRLSILGRACGESPLSLESAMQAVDLVRRLPREEANIENLLVLIEALPERDADYTPQTRGAGEAVWQQEAARRFSGNVSGLLRVGAGSDREHYARCKRALIVRDWIDGKATSEIETRFSANAFSRVGHGDVRGYADGCRFLLESVVRIAAIILGTAENPDEASALYKRLELGVPVEVLSLVHARVVLNRGEILLLWRAGITTLPALSEMSSAECERIVGTRAVALIEMAVLLTRQMT
ncbi:DEAD/DEAH box helicase [Glaciimonas sp. PCH181]|uniref:DEAD/DEAH box helicase n=1 Tax=Glaciimonas sp. PCH181 TaxID=2133943 RepID=UPI00191BDE20|nr:DEAD/DEAH box helicase [Glaciimonas sp. PCH181]